MIVVALFVAAWLAVSLVAAGVIGRGLKVCDRREQERRWDW